MKTAENAEITENDLWNTSIGRKILNNLRSHQTIIKKPLPRCIFSLGDWIAYKKISQKTSCINCDFLYTTTSSGWTKSCYGILGPKKKYVKDNSMIYDYFNTFHSQFESLKKCKKCIYFNRKQCNCLCFKKIDKMPGLLQ